MMRPHRGAPVNPSGTSDARHRNRCVVQPPNRVYRGPPVDSIRRHPGRTFLSLWWSEGRRYFERSGGSPPGWRSTAPIRSGADRGRHQTRSNAIAIPIVVGQFERYALGNVSATQLEADTGLAATRIRMILMTRCTTAGSGDTAARTRRAARRRGGRRRPSPTNRGLESSTHSSRSGLYRRCGRARACRASLREPADAQLTASIAASSSIGSTTTNRRTSRCSTARASGSSRASVTRTSAWSSRAMELIPMTPHFV